MSRRQEIRIKELEQDNHRLIDMVTNLESQLEKLVFMTPCKLLTSLVDKYQNDYKLGKVVRNMSWNESIPDQQKYIYESPDGGETIYRRKFNDYDNREQVNHDIDPQLNLFNE